MTTQRTTALGQRRFYTFEPLRLDPAVVWKDLSYCQYAASRVLHDIRIAWDRAEGDDTLIMSFNNTQGEQFQASWSLSVVDPSDFDDSTPASLTRFALHQAEWALESSLVRVSDRHEMDNDDLFDMVDGRSITVEDIWPALQALHSCVCAHSERIYGIHDPQEPLFWINAQMTTDAASDDQSGAISAEKRMLAYEDYMLNLDGISDDFSPREQAALSCMADIHITWEGDGYPSTVITFIAPDEFGYSADVVPIWEQETGSEACWHVEVHSNMTTKLVKRAGIYSRLPNGETVTFEDVIGVVVVLQQFLTQCEDDGYPAFDEQMV